MTVGELCDKCVATCISFYINRPGEGNYISIENKQIRETVKDCEVKHYAIGTCGGSLAMIIYIDEVQK